MIVKAVDDCVENSFMLFMSRQDAMTLIDIFDSWVCKHDKRKIGDAESARGIISVVINSTPQLHRLIIQEKAVGDPVYVISLKNHGADLSKKYNYFGVLFKNDMAEFLGVSEDEAEKLYRSIVKKD